MRAEELMTRNVGTCRPDDTADVAVDVMVQQDCGAVPVIETDGYCVGMVTDRDICLGASRQHRRIDEVVIATVMSGRAVTCRPHDTISFIERLMRQNQVRRIPVVSRDGQVLGIVSQSDLVREAVAEIGSARPEVTAEEVAATLGAIGAREHSRILGPLGGVAH